MNVGIPTNRRSAQAGQNAGIARPRSPETKTGANRARSPALGKSSAPNPSGLNGPAARPSMTPGGPLGSGSLSKGSQPTVRRVTSSTVEEIRRIDANREQRRRQAEEVRRSRQEEAALLGAQCGGHVPDIDFHRMIQNYRLSQQCPQPTRFEPLDPGAPEGVIVCVRKRPIMQHEVTNSELDCVTACNPCAVVHETKLKVDGITKCLESHQFEFDRVFDEECTTEDVYTTVASPIVPWVLAKGGRATLFAYGQTGSGKTFTMTGIQRLLTEQLFEHVKRASSLDLTISISFFEIYGGRPFDLLNNRQRLETLEDANNEVQIAGLVERGTSNPQEMQQCIDLGNSLRTTQGTAINRDSSRSHAICVVFLRKAGGGSIHGKVTLVDLAGSERAADSKSSIRQRRVEGAQINKSLLALKECIRAMGDRREAHVPFRASKLTLVLRDAFISRCPAKTVMIACISPGMASADHSVNTLRYSDRLKEHPRSGKAVEDGDSAAGRRLSTGIRNQSPDRKLQGNRRSPSPNKLERPAMAGIRQRPNSGTVPDLAKDETLDLHSEEELLDEDLEEYEDKNAAPHCQQAGFQAPAAPPAAPQAWAESRLWEDRIVTQHMHALQEDARLLTKESELLSQVQQGAAYDLEWYALEVDKIVRRKVEVYMNLMEDLAAFKAQIKRDEAHHACGQGVGTRRLSRAEGPQPAPSTLNVPQTSPRLHAAMDGNPCNPQRTPRTPRLHAGELPTDVR
ncbi:KIF2A [Symbiodinium pilosum]|uniref:Kinesin-like protein n=1 Tax=Symbiodinium pilosum TaxID=2952 RepID=A0A812K4E6_SYMPI|nr:KIF2A [Symbiodinium pilosum]